MQAQFVSVDIFHFARRMKELCKRLKPKYLKTTPSGMRSRHDRDSFWTRKLETLAPNAIKENRNIVQFCDHCRSVMLYNLTNM